VSITPDWDAWNALPPEEQARRLAARLRKDGRDVTVVDSRQPAARPAAGRQEPARTTPGRSR
jgi:hypothetical protein